MSRQVIDAKSLEEYLSSPLEKNSSSESEKAKEALLETLRRSKQMLGKTHHVHIGLYDRPFHDCDINYLRSLMRVKKDLVQKKWSAACSDLQDVLHFYEINDGRILNEIIRLLEEYLL